MAFIDGGEAVRQRLRASRAKTALAAVWAIGILAAVGLMVSPRFLPKPIPRVFRGLSGEELLAMDLNDYAERVYLREAGKAEPNDPIPWYGLAAARTRLGKLEEAESSARRSIEIAPDRGEGHSLLARALMAQARPADALKAARNGAVRAPGFVALRQDEAMALVHLGDLPGAEKVYADLAAKDPDNPVWLAHRATALFGLDRFVESRKFLDEAIMKARALVEADRENTPRLQEVMSLCEPVEKSLAAKGFPTQVPAWSGPGEEPPRLPLAPRQ